MVWRREFSTIDSPGLVVQLRYVYMFIRSARSPEDSILMAEKRVTFTLYDSSCLFSFHAKILFLTHIA